MRIIEEFEFRQALIRKLEPFRGVFRAVTGPGRSGAIASVYASHYLKIPMLPVAEGCGCGLTPLLVIDTAVSSGRTMRKAMKKCGSLQGIAIFNEPPRVKFWYEVLE